MSDEQTTLDADLIALMDAGIAIGLSGIPDSATPEIRSLAEQAVARAMLWVVRQIKPEQIKVLVEAKADATAEIDWGEE